MIKIRKEVVGKIAIEEAVSLNVASVKERHISIAHASSKFEHSSTSNQTMPDPNSRRACPGYITVAMTGATPRKEKNNTKWNYSIGRGGPHQSPPWPGQPTSWVNERDSPRTGAGKF